MNFLRTKLGMCWVLLENGKFIFKILPNGFLVWKDDKAFENKDVRTNEFSRSPRDDNPIG